MTAPEKKGQLAQEYFESGCNCSQAVLLAFAPDCGLERDTALALASFDSSSLGRATPVFPASTCRAS